MNNQPVEILMIEDNPGDVRLIREMLTEQKDFTFRMTSLGSLRAGIEHLWEHKPAVILLDLTLPDRQGLATFTKLHEVATQIPIVVLTGMNDMKLAISAVQAGAEDYLVKSDENGPLLIRAICYAIERARLRHALEDALAHVKTLRGLIPICAQCKKVRDDQGYWKQVEDYVSEHSNALFSHSYCPECADGFMNELNKLCQHRTSGEPTADSGLENR